MTVTDDLKPLLEEALSNPLLINRVNGSGGRSSNGHAPAEPSGGSLTRTAQGAIRDLLGWRYRADDPKGFLAALNKAVDLKEVDGHVEYKWSARPFMVAADLGEVTGAQASIYERARVAIEHALPLLDGLTPLRPRADLEKTESVRSLVRSALTELLAELGNVGGPRVQRVDQYFSRLLGIDENKLDTVFSTQPGSVNPFNSPENVDGLLGELLHRFGLKRDHVLTVDEERVLTNALIVVDYTTTLFQTWIAQKQYIERGGTAHKFLGTQLVRLSQMLNVIVESVHEAYGAMDSVFFGADERDVTEIEVGESGTSATSRITVGELLAWVEHFAAVEAPQLIEDSGKDGVRDVRTTLDVLRAYVEKASKVDPSTLPSAFGSRRVIRSLIEIANYLEKGVEIADGVTPPKGGPSLPDAGTVGKGSPSATDAGTATKESTAD